jgi:Sugar kinases, ribokinase family
MPLHASKQLVKTAKESGAIISYDLNYCAPLWKSKEEAAGQMSAALALADMVKVSEEELELLTGVESV